MYLNQFPFVEEPIVVAVWLYLDAQDQMTLHVNLHYFSKASDILHTFLFSLASLEDSSFMEPNW